MLLVVHICSNTTLFRQCPLLRGLRCGSSTSSSSSLQQPSSASESSSPVSISLFSLCLRRYSRKSGDSLASRKSAISAHARSLSFQTFPLDHDQRRHHTTDPETSYRSLATCGAHLPAANDTITSKHAAHPTLGDPNNPTLVQNSRVYIA